MSSKTIRQYKRLSWHFVETKDRTTTVFDVEGNSLYNEIVGPSGADLPNWRDVIKNHVDAGNTGSSLYVNFSGGTGNVHKTYTTSGIIPAIRINWDLSVNGFLGSISGFGGQASDSSSASNRAIGDFSKKAIQRISPFSGGVFLGEIREAIHQIRHPAEALFRGVKAYIYESKKLRKKIGRRPFRRIAAQSWLEAVYGWLPLISDVKSGAEALSRTINEFRPNEKVVSAKMIDEKLIQPATRVQRSNDNISWDFYQSIKDEMSYRVEGAVRIDPPGSLKGSMDTFGISWDQVLPTAWELLPFSFVSDYFSNIGDVIASASILNGRCIYISQTKRLKRTLVCDGWRAIQGSQTDAYNVIHAGPFKAVLVQYGRTKLASAIPSLQFEIPGLRSMKWLNLAALTEALRD